MLVVQGNETLAFAFAFARVRTRAYSKHAYPHRRVDLDKLGNTLEELLGRGCNLLHTHRPPKLKDDPQNDRCELPRRDDGGCSTPQPRPTPSCQLWLWLRPPRDGEQLQRYGSQRVRWRCTSSLGLQFIRHRCQYLVG